MKNKIERKAFNFYKSYYDILEFLDDKDKLEFLMALLEKQFNGVEPTLSRPGSKMAYASQKYNIDQQVKGWEDKMKTSLTPPTEPPTEGGYLPPTEPPSLQEQEQEQEQVKEKVKDKVITNKELIPEVMEKKLNKSFFSNNSNTEVLTEVLPTIFDITNKPPKEVEMEFEKFWEKRK